jgi:hypothetical protein
VEQAERIIVPRECWRSREGLGRGKVESGRAVDARSNRIACEAELVKNLSLVDERPSREISCLGPEVQPIPSTRDISLLRAFLRELSSSKHEEIGAEMRLREFRDFAKRNENINHNDREERMGEEVS